MKNSFEKILISFDEINNRVLELSKEINDFYKNSKNVLIVPIMDGSLVFAGQLLINFDFDLILKSTRISLYGDVDQIDREKAKNIKIDFDLNLIKDKDILIIEDLIDTGNTLKILREFFLLYGAKSINICVLFKKEINPREVEIDCKWVGFSVPNKWIAGYGVDSNLKLRNFKHLGIVKNEK